MSFPGGSGRWGVRKSQFRQDGLPHQLMVLSDLSRELRDEERQAWQRLVRVLGHELNNSLAPIKSIACSLQTIVSRPVLPTDWHEDLKHGLEVIHTRADALNRFIGAYAQLARLPQPRLVPVDVPRLIARVSGFETRLQLIVKPGPLVNLRADPDQLEQLLINLVRNAVDATLEADPLRSSKTNGDVRIGWTAAPGRVEIWVADTGAGVANSANLFVPFFTTKPKGSGIGLVLSRQIAEAHGGRLTLENQPGGGCLARLWLPIL
jgi:signal transduction histidine kinase